MLNLVPVVEILIGLASAAVTAAIPILVPYILKRLHIANDADLVAKIDMAATAGAGVAFKFAASHDGGLARIDVHDKALKAGADYVLNAVPETLDKLGITNDSVTNMVSARLGVLLASAPDQGVIAKDVPGSASNPLPTTPGAITPLSDAPVAPKVT